MSGHDPRLSVFFRQFRATPPRKETNDDPARTLDKLEKFVPEDMKRAYNILQVIKAIVDDGDFFELKAKFARNFVIGFGRLNGYPVGFVANQPMFLAGSLDVDASDKAARFIRFCDAFNIPVITLMDVPGFSPANSRKKKASFATARRCSTPTLKRPCQRSRSCSKRLRRRQTSACTREMGADQLFVWPGVELAVMGGGGAVNVLIGEKSSNRPIRQKPAQKKSLNTTNASTAPSKRFPSSSPRRQSDR